VDELLHVAADCAGANLAGAIWDFFVTEQIYTFTPLNN